MKRWECTLLFYSDFENSSCLMAASKRGAHSHNLRKETVWQLLQCLLWVLFITEWIISGKDWYEIRTQDDDRSCGEFRPFFACPLASHTDTEGTLSASVWDTPAPQGMTKRRQYVKNLFWFKVSSPLMNSEIHVNRGRKTTTTNRPVV